MDLPCGLKVKPAISFSQTHADHLLLNHNAIHPTPPHCELIISLQKQQLNTLQHKILNNEMRATLKVKGQLSVGIMVGTYIRINASHKRANLAMYQLHTHQLDTPHFTRHCAWVKTGGLLAPRKFEELTLFCIEAAAWRPLLIANKFH